MRRLKSSMKSEVKAVTQTWLPLIIVIKPGHNSEELRYSDIIVLKYIQNIYKWIIIDAYFWVGKINSHVKIVWENVLIFFFFSFTCEMFHL